MKSNNQIIAISNFIKKRKQLVIQIEKYLLILFFSGVVLFQIKISNLNFIFIASGFLLGIYYFFRSMEIIESDELSATNIWNTQTFFLFFHKLAFFSLSLTSVSLVMLATNFPNQINIFFVTIIPLLLAFGFFMVNKIKNASLTIIKPYLNRLLAAIFILGLFYIVEFHIK